MKHITVLQSEAVSALALKPESTVVDATLGAGGHARLILKELSKKGTYIGIDADQTAIDALAELKKSSATVHLVKSNFSKLDTVLADLQIKNVDAILADLGWRLEQFTEGKKGFSFLEESELHMTYGDPSDYSFTAASIVNEWAEADIANVLYGYGEERYARKIARAIVSERIKNPILTAKQLAELISSTVPASYKRGKTHPATKSFQGLRIAVNDEFTVLETFIHTALQELRAGGRLAIITFHSLEDRIVKHLFRSFAHDQKAILVNKKPISPTPEEIKSNPRARSAKLRVLEKC